MELTPKQRERADIRNEAYRIRGKGFYEEPDIASIWTGYEKLFGTYDGNKGCGDCIREAIKKIIIETETL